MFERNVQGFNVLAGQESTHGFNGSLHGHERFDAQFFFGPVYTFQCCLDIEGVLAGFDKQEIGSALEQAGGLFLVRYGEFFPAYAPGDRQGPGGGPHRTRDEARLSAGGGLVGCLAGNFGTQAAQLAGAVGELVLLEYNRA